MKEGEEGEKGEGDSKETEDENKEEKKKDSRATNIRKKLSFKKSFSFLRKKAAKDAAAKEEKVEEGEKEETKEKVEEKVEESSPKETETESSSKPEESSTEKVEDAPAPPTEAPPGKRSFYDIALPPPPPTLLKKSHVNRHILTIKNAFFYKKFFEANFLQSDKICLNLLNRKSPPPFLIPIVYYDFLEFI